MPHIREVHPTPLSEDARCRGRGLHGFAGVDESVTCHVSLLLPAGRIRLVELMLTLLLSLLAVCGFFALDASQPDEWEGMGNWSWSAVCRHEAPWGGEFLIGLVGRPHEAEGEATAVFP